MGKEEGWTYGHLHRDKPSVIAAKPAWYGKSLCVHSVLSCQSVNSGSLDGLRTTSRRLSKQRLDCQQPQNQHRSAKDTMLQHRNQHHSCRNYSFVMQDSR